jgi:arsenite methyltransferase
VPRVGYRSLAARYLVGESAHPGGRDLTNALLDRVDPGGPHDLVDVACGTGLTAVMAARGGATVRGYDVEPAVVAAARRRVAKAKLTDRVTIAVADAHDLPAEPASADVVVCECALSTFADPPCAVAEMVRVLRPGGRLALTDVTWEEPRVAPHVRDLLLRLTTPRAAGEYEEWVRAAGLDIEVVEDRTTDVRQLLDRLEKRLFFSKRWQRVVDDVRTAVDGGALSYLLLVAVRR